MNELLQKSIDMGIFNPVPYVRALPIHPDIRGECDDITRNKAIEIVKSMGYNLIWPRIKTPGIDVLAQSTMYGSFIILDVEKGLNFYDGVYRSPKFDSVSIPARKGPLFKTGHAWWLCISRDMKNHILLSGDEILQRGVIQRYPTKLTEGSGEEDFFMLPRLSVDIRSI